METILPKLETTSKKTEFAEQIHSESSSQEAETTSEMTELADQSSSKNSSQEAGKEIPNNSDKRITVPRWRRNSKN